jgi:hypothetical protein
MDLDSPGSLREFELRDFSFPCSCNPLKCSISEVGDFSPRVLVDRWSRFASRLREFMNAMLGNLLEWYRLRSDVVA